MALSPGTSSRWASLIYEAVTGKKAFSGKSQASLMASILHHNPSLLRGNGSRSPWMAERKPGGARKAD